MNDQPKLKEEDSMSTEPTTRIEWTGNIEVHHPIRPTVHALLTEAQVSCA